MNKNISVVAALLLILSGGMATAAENPEHQSPNARKVLTMLAAVGIDDPRVKSFIGDVDQRVDNGYLRIAEDHTMGGTLRLHYELSGGVSGKQAELQFQPDDSNFKYTARTNAVMVKYQLNF